MTTTESRQLTFCCTVNRTLVHRDSLGEVFLTDLHADSDVGYNVAAMLPRSHSYYGDHLLRPAMYDPLLLLETSRQACLAGAHAFFDVPLGDKFVLTFLRVSIIRSELLTIGSQPLRLTMKVTVKDSRVRDGRVTGLDSTLELSVDGTIVGWTGVGLRFRNADSYAELRAGNRNGKPLPSSAELPPEPTRNLVTPHLVGRALPGNVILTDATHDNGSAHAALHVPPAHPSLFDHAQDHLPGMVLTEAARQLALFAALEARGLSAGKVFPRGINVVFTRFGELEPPTTLSAKVGADDVVGAQYYTLGGPLELPGEENGQTRTELPVTVSAWQEDKELATCAITLATLTD